MKKFVIQFIFLVIVIFAALYIATRNVDLPFLPQPPKSSQLRVNNLTLNVEIAETDSKRKKGLGERESLATDSGMLFIFPQPGIYQFWMKGLKFPLDLIWIKDGAVADIIKNAQDPQPGQSDETLPVYAPTQPVDQVLEVNAGFVDAHGIKVGERVEIIK